MEVVNKLIDNDEALVNQFESDAKCDVGTSGAATDQGSKLGKQPSKLLAAKGRRDDLEVTTIGGPDEATTTTAVTIDVTMVMTVAAMIGAVMSNNRRTAAMTMTYLLHQPQATPMGPSSRTRGRST
jgi:hypothetical protein